MRVDRVLYTNTEGYECIIEPDKPVNRAARLTHHRLLMYLEDEISFRELVDFEKGVDPEVDHLTEIRWLSVPSNLEVVEHEENLRRRHARTHHRKGSVPQWVIDDAILEKSPWVERTDDNQHQETLSHYKPFRGMIHE